MKTKWKLDERDDGNIDLQIEDDDGAVQRILVRLPPSAARQEMLDAALRSIAHQRAHARLSLHKEHARLQILLGKLQTNARKNPATPPVLAELFISFLAPKNSAQGLLGDLQEVFQKNAERYGEKQARRKYWIEVASSFGPLLLQWGKRIGLFTVLIDYFRSKFGL